MKDIQIVNRFHPINRLKARNRELESENEKLKAANEVLIAANEVLTTSNKELNDLKTDLESIVKQRRVEMNKLSFLFEELISNTTDGIFFMDVTPERKFRFTRFSPVIENSLKLNNSELGKGKMVEELFNADEAAYFNGQYSKCVDSGKPINYEEFIGINNQNTYWNTTLIPIRNKSCEIESIIGVARNVTREKEIEKALRESEHKYKTLFDKMMDAFVLYEPFFDENGNVTDFRYIETNPAFDIHSNIPSELCLGKLFKDVHRMNPGENTITQYIEVFNSGHAKSFEIYSRPYDKYYIVNAYKLTENRLASIFQDITNKKKAELLLASSNASLQAIINSSPAAIIDIDSQGKVKSVWNPAAESIFGWTKEEAIGKFIPYIPDSDLNEFNSLRNSIMSGSSVSNFELQRKRKDGTDIVINLASAPIYNDKDQIESIIAIITDTTEKKKLEREIITSELKFRKLFNLSFDGITISDLGLNILEVNEAILNLTGYSKEEFLHMSYLDLFPPKFHPVFNERQKDLLEGKELPFLEADFVSRNGKRLSVAVNTRLIELNDQKCFMTVTRDITAQKLMQQRIYEAIIEVEENERRKLAGDLHDEIGPQLASMRMYTSSLMRSESDDYTRNIHNTLMELILKSISDIRDISNNLSPVTLQRYGLVNAINAECEVIRALMPVTFEHNIKNIRFNHRIEIVIYRIIKELLNNTKKHTTADKTAIKLNIEADLLTLEYTDNGKDFNFSKIIESGNKGMGLLNIEMRVNSINGTSKFSNTHDGGFYFKMQATV